MTLETVRAICLALPDTTEDIKWGQDLVFSTGTKMFCVVNMEPPHQLAFKTTPELFGELVERPGIRPAPYLARAMWVQEETLGETLERGEAERLINQAYELVRSTLPRHVRERRAATSGSRPRGGSKKTGREKRSGRVTAARRSRAAPARTRRRRR